MVKVRVIEPIPVHVIALDLQVVPVEVNSPVVIMGGDLYQGDYIVDPDFSKQVLETKDHIMEDDVVVNPIQVSRTSNQYGTTVYIGGIING